MWMCDVGWGGGVVKAGPLYGQKGTCTHTTPTHRHKDFLAALYHYVKITVGKGEAESVDPSAINEYGQTNRACTHGARTTTNNRHYTSNFAPDIRRWSEDEVVDLWLSHLKRYAAEEKNALGVFVLSHTQNPHNPPRRKKKKDKKKAEAHPNSTDPDDAAASTEHSAPRGSPGVPPSYDGVSDALHTSALRNTSGLSSSSVATTAASDDAGVPAAAAPALLPPSDAAAASAARMPAVSTTAAGVQNLRTFSVSAGAAGGAGSGRGTLAATARASGGLGRGRAKAVSEPPTPTVTFGSLRGGGGGSAPPTPTVRVVEARDPRPGLSVGPRKPSFSLPNSPDPFSGSHQSVSKQQQLAKDILGALNRTAAADRGSDSAPDGGDGPVRPAAATPTSPQIGPASASRVKEITNILSASASSGPARGIVVEGGSIEVGPLSAVHGGRARRSVTMLNRVLASGLHGVSFPAAAGCRFGYSVSLGGAGSQLSVVFTCVGRLSFSRHLSLSLSAPVAAVEWRRDIPTSFLAPEAVAGLVGQGWSAKVLGATRLHEMTYLRLALEDGGGGSGVDEEGEDGLHQDLLFAPSPYGAVSVVMGDGERTATHFLCPVQDLLRHEPVRRPASVPGTPTLQPQQLQ